LVEIAGKFFKVDRFLLFVKGFSMANVAVDFAGKKNNSTNRFDKSQSVC
jgi:hypothetical protein